MIFRILEDQYAEKSKASKAADQRFMALALALGRRGQGRTWPNPAVGAVIVKDGVIVGRGWTQPGGRPHAEPEALKRGTTQISAPSISVGSTPSVRALSELRARMPGVRYLGVCIDVALLGEFEEVCRV